MSTSHQHIFRKTKRLKALSIGFLLLFDKIGVLKYIVPIVNKIVKFFGVKKELNENLNYRIYAKSFENAFLSNETNKSEQKKALFFFTMGSESSYLLRQLIIAKYLESLHWKVEFLCCTGFTNACNKERIGKSQEDTPFMCSECSWGYSYIQEKTKVPINYLEKKKLDHDEIEKITTLSSIEECINYQTKEQIPLGEITKVNVLRYFYQGTFYDTKDELKIYKKYLRGTLQATKSIESYLSSHKIDLVLTMNGSGNLDQSMICFAKKQGINYITQESFIGTNSWIYKKNGIAIHLDFISEWEKYGSKLSEVERNKLHQFLFKIKKGEVYTTKLHDSEIGELTQKKGVTLFTNMNFDTYVLGRNSLFSSMENWLIETITFWKENVKEIPLYIRAHPGEYKMATPAVKFTRDIVNHLLSDTIILIDSNSDINSYSLVLNSHYVITYSSTIGVEAMMMDVPCVSAGEAFYKPFAIAPQNKLAYFEILEKMNENPRIYPIHEAQLESYLYYLYFIKTTHFKGFDINRAISKIELANLGNYEKLVEINKEILDTFYNQCVIDE